MAENMKKKISCRVFIRKIYSDFFVNTIVSWQSHKAINFIHFLLLTCTAWLGKFLWQKTSLWLHRHDKTVEDGSQCMKKKILSLDVINFIDGQIFYHISSTWSSNSSNSVKDIQNNFPSKFISNCLLILCFFIFVYKWQIFFKTPDYLLPVIVK